MKFFITFLMVLSFSFSAFADSIKVRVTESVPIYKRSIVQIPHTDYIEKQFQVPYECKSSDTNSIGIDTIVGGIIGVAIGNQIGGGRGRDVAKVVGGLGGATVANNMRTKKCYRMEFRKVPITSYTEEVRERLVGYKNCGYIDGRKICKRTKNKLRYIYLTY